MGDYQGVRMLFPPFKGDSRGFEEILHYVQNDTLEKRCRR